MPSYRRPDGTGGPTNTFTHQREFAQRLRGVLSRINARIREAIDENDLFNLRDEALVDDVPEEVFQTDNSQAKLSAFLGWIRQQLDTEFLEVVGPDRNEFLELAYLTGIRNANQNLSELDISFTRPNVEDLVSRPIHRTALQTLYTRAYENLVSVRDDVVTEVRDTLVEGLREGKNPREIARELTGRVDSIGKHRSTLIARSEIINAHSEATLNRYESVRDDTGVDIGLQHGEWQTAGDDRVCPICKVLDGATFTLSEMRTTRFTLGGTTFQVKPPAHPQGRCTILPVVGLDTSELPPLDERLPDADSVQ